VPIIVAICLMVALPESLKYLVLHAKQKAELVRVLRQLKPDATITPETQFILRGEEIRTRATVKDLFVREYAYTTVLLWTLFIVNGLILAFVQSWTPTLLATTGISAGHAALAVSMWQIGGAVGGLSAGRAVDKFGVFPLVVLMIIAIPIVGAIGSPGLSQALIMSALFAGGFCLIGVQFGINAISGMVYPTFVRSNGVGWALGIARIGGIAGSLMGGYLIAMHVTLQHVYYVATAPIVVTIIAASLLTRSFVNRS
jgi:MFS transporter, AAHS family, 4-hydroxybenzoate transporter